VVVVDNSSNSKLLLRLEIKLIILTIFKLKLNFLIKLKYSHFMSENQGGKTFSEKKVTKYDYNNSLVIIAKEPIRNT